LPKFGHALAAATGRGVRPFRFGIGAGQSTAARAAECVGVGFVATALLHAGRANPAGDSTAATDDDGLSAREQTARV
jgi:hypothetical protein